MSVKWILLTNLVIKESEVIVMTLNIFFISITFKKHKESLQEAARNEMIEKLYEQNKERQLTNYHLL
ncbi:YrzI family small protein [Neobacillus sp. DY30]|uniref:YrzI family small protein n=1 Tax=Neobacillus sp. DY30 TaxID=3047871 RepID=UPI0024BF6946|nr:YrzI family small protein [Neobacillus sp. DY30]WHX99400.1 YrzI family small protein [Neobacillus sp. DY30]